MGTVSDLAGRIIYAQDQLRCSFAQLLPPSLLPVFCQTRLGGHYLPSADADAAVAAVAVAVAAVDAGLATPGVIGAAPFGPGGTPS